MKLSELVDRLLLMGQRPSRPSRSVFGAEASHELTLRRKSDEYEFEVSWIKGTPRGL